MLCRIALLLLILFHQIIQAETITPFQSDGCSAFPDGTPEQQQLWLSCCEAHDRAYWQGGSYQQRLQADLTLKQCVSDVGEPVIAELMLSGVRVGGSPYWPTQFRWGYGWSYPRGYTSDNNPYELVTPLSRHIIQLLIWSQLILAALLIFGWRRLAWLHRAFNMQGDINYSHALARNVGLLQAILAAGLLWGWQLQQHGVAIYLFFLISLIISGLYASVIFKRLWFILLQTLPALIALLLLVAHQ